MTSDGKYHYSYPIFFDETDFANFALKIKDFGQGIGDYISIENGNDTEVPDHFSDEGVWIGDTLYAMFEWSGETLQAMFECDRNDSVDTIIICLGTASKEKPNLNYAETPYGQVTGNAGIPLGDSGEYRYTVTASAASGYEYDGYTLTTASGAKTEVSWDSVNYTYDTKEKTADEVNHPGDARASTATFDVTITEDSTLDFHFKEIDTAGLLAPDKVTTSRYKGTEETSASLTRQRTPKDQTPVTCYKAGDWAYINIHGQPLHGTIPYMASEEDIKITVYKGNGIGAEKDVLLRDSKPFFLGGTWNYSYPANSHPYVYPGTGEADGIGLDLHLQLPESDYITAVVEWPYYNQTWTIPIKVMDSNNPYMGHLRNLYNRLQTNTGYDPFRYYLETIYEEESGKLLEMTADEQAAYISTALQNVEDASKGKGTDAVVWRFVGINHGKRDDSLPILIAVPPDTTNGHVSMIAALGAAFPNNWTYEYSLAVSALQ